MICARRAAAKYFGVNLSPGDCAGLAGEGQGRPKVVPPAASHARHSAQQERGRAY